MINVTIHAVSTDPSPVDVEGIIVRVFDESGVFITEGTTDATGKVVFILSESTTYILRFGSTIFTPYSIETPRQIITELIDVTYTVQVELYQRPVATDPNLCRVSGYIKDGLGRPQVRCRVIVAPTAEIRSIGESVVIPKAFFLWTDSNGYLEVDCLRGVDYSFKVATALRDSSGVDFVTFTIPDAASASLPDLITDN